MHVIPNGPQSWSNLPREKGISYATQESWVQNETIRVSDKRMCKKLTYETMSYRTTFCLAHLMMKRATSKYCTSAHSNLTSLFLKRETRLKLERKA